MADITDPTELSRRRAELRQELEDFGQWYLPEHIAEIEAEIADIDRTLGAEVASPAAAEAPGVLAPVEEPSMAPVEVAPAEAPEPAAIEVVEPVVEDAAAGALDEPMAADTEVTSDELTPSTWLGEAADEEPEAPIVVVPPPAQDAAPPVEVEEPSAPAEAVVGTVDVPIEEPAAPAIELVEPAVEPGPPVDDAAGMVSDTGAGTAPAEGFVRFDGPPIYEDRPPEPGAPARPDEGAIDDATGLAAAGVLAAAAAAGPLGPADPFAPDRETAGEAEPAAPADDDDVEDEAGEAGEAAAAGTDAGDGGIDAGTIAAGTVAAATVADGALGDEAGEEAPSAADAAAGIGATGPVAGDEPPAGEDSPVAEDSPTGTAAVGVAAAAGSADLDEAEPVVEPTEAPSDTPPPRRVQPWLIALAILALVVIVVVVIVALTAGGGDDEEPAASATSEATATSAVATTVAGTTPATEPPSDTTQPTTATSVPTGDDTIDTGLFNPIQRIEPLGGAIVGGEDGYTDTGGQLPPQVDFAVFAGVTEEGTMVFTMVGEQQLLEASFWKFNAVDESGATVSQTSIVGTGNDATGVGLAPEGTVVSWEDARTMTVVADEAQEDVAGVLYSVIAVDEPFATLVILASSDLGDDSVALGTWTLNQEQVVQIAALGVTDPLGAAGDSSILGRPALVLVNVTQ